MKTLRFLPLAVLIFASSARAQVFSEPGGAQAEIVKQHALKLRDANNAAQGVATPGYPNAPAMAAPAPMPNPNVSPGPHGIDPGQQQLINKTAEDLGAIKSGTPITDTQKDTLSTNILNLAKGANKPSKEALAKLSQDLLIALSAPGVNLKDNAMLARGLNVVVNCQHITAAQADMFVHSTENVLKTAGVPAEHIQMVSNDLKAIVTDIRKTKSSLYP